MAKYSFSDAHPDLLDPANWLVDVEEALLIDAVHIKSLAANGLPHPRFQNQLPSEIDEHFWNRIEESEQLATLNLFAAAEAAIRIDFGNRVLKRTKKGKSLNTLFKSAHAANGARLRLKEDILDLWKSQEPSTTGSINAFANALNTRHWLAHGRYWTFTKGPPADFPQASIAVAALITALSASSSGFFPDPI